MLPLRCLALAGSVALVASCGRDARHPPGRRARETTHAKTATPARTTSTTSTTTRRAAVVTAPSFARVYGGSGYDAAHAVAVRADGAWWVVGESESNDGDVRGSRGETDAWLLSIDARGALVRSQVLGGSAADSADAVVSTPDGGAVIAGSTCSIDGDVVRRRGGTIDDTDIWVTRVDRDGRVLWTRTVGGSREDVARSIVATTDGGFLVAGDSSSHDGDMARARIDRASCPTRCVGTSDFVLAKLDANGRLEWTRAFGGSNHEHLSQLVATRDGGYALVGRTESFDGLAAGFRGEYDALVVRLDRDARVRWSRVIGGQMWDWGSSVAELGGGDLVVAGYTYSVDADSEGNHGDYDYLVTRMASDGTVRWSRVFGGLVDDFAHSIMALRDGTLLVTGGSTSSDGDIGAPRGDFDLWVTRTSADGALLAEQSVGGSGYDISGLGASSVELADGSVVIVGESRSSDRDALGAHGDYDAFVARILPSAMRRVNAAAPAVAPTPTPRLAPAAVGPVAAGAPGVGPGGGIAWSRTFGGALADRPLDAPQALTRTRAGGFAFVATTESLTTSGGNGDVWLVVTDAEGRELGSRTLGGSGRDVGAAIAEADDGDLVVVATTDSNDGDIARGNAHGMTDVFVARVRPGGAIRWARTLGGSLVEQATSIAATLDGGFVVGGNAYSSDGDVRGHRCAYDQWVVKLGGDGAIEWSRTYGGSSNELLIQIVATRDGGYAAIGRTESDDGNVSDNHGTYDYWVTRLDRDGRLLWERSYGSWDWEWGNSIAELDDGGFVVGGYTYTFEDFEDGDVTTSHGEFDYWVLRLEDDGDIVWQRSYGGSNYELGYGVIALRNGGFAMIGGSPSRDGQVERNHGDWDAWLVRLADDGALVSSRSLGGAGYDAGYAIVEDARGGLVVLGETYSNDGDVTGLHGDEDVWLFRLVVPRGGTDSL